METMTAMALEDARALLKKWCGPNEKAQPVRAGLLECCCRLQDSNPPPDDYEFLADLNKI
jgi:hypothetical protein